MTLDEKVAYIRILTARLRKYNPTVFEMLFRPRIFRRKERIFLLLSERRAYIYKWAIAEAYELGWKAAREEAKEEFIMNCANSGWRLSNPADINRLFPETHVKITQP